jgi:hypothetical protein
LWVRNIIYVTFGRANGTRYGRLSHLMVVMLSLEMSR